MTQSAARRYSDTHQWALPIGEDLYSVGITDFAQQQLGDVMFVNFPQLNQAVQQGESCATVESVKSASDVYSPLAGSVVEVNHELTSALENINSDPYGSWLFKIKCSNKTDFEKLLTEEQYQQLTK
ncbi:MAG: glycine cleavage system protein GcvH [Betaproteobacteria bacterium]|nr:glycine cleavage system protein GcvH [Betaproteobacteria bacterium]MDE2423267.1 glycine cleavage system protein GcvH [Betaproteobacteria bacterium]